MAKSMCKDVTPTPTDHAAGQAAQVAKPKHRKRRVVRLACVLLVAMLVALGFYYQKKTYFPIYPIDSRVTFAGKPLGIYYLDMPIPWRPAGEAVDPEGFGLRVDDRGLSYRHPVIQCELVFDAYHVYAQTKSPQDAQAVVRLADLLVGQMKNVKLGGVDCTVLQYDAQLDACMPHPIPWISSMAQGMAMSALCRAYEVEPKPEYLQAAKACLAVFDVDVKDGGVRGMDEQGNVYYEEYPFPGQAYHVLNGFIYTLLGLHDLNRATGDEKAGQLFAQGLATLKAPGVLDRYDMGYWTTYDQSPFHWPSFNYNAIHVRQLWVLHKITGDQLFKDTADKWMRYNLEHKYRIQFFASSSVSRVMRKCGAYRPK